MSIRKILDYLEGLDSKTLPVISKTRSSNPLTFDKNLPMDDGIKWDKNGFAPKIQFKGKDGNDYLTSESLRSADNEYRKRIYQYKALDGNDYQDYESVLSANAEYYRQLGFEYVLIEVIKGFPYMNEHMFYALIQTFEGSDEQRRLIINTIEILISDIAKIDFISNDFKLLIHNYFNYFFDSFNFLNKYRKIIETILNRQKSNPTSNTKAKTINPSSTETKDSNPKAKNNLSQLDLLMADEDTVNILNGTIPRQLLTMEKNMSKKQIGFLSFKYNIRVEPYIYRKYAMNNKNFTEIRITEVEAVEIMKKIGLAISDVINKNRKR